MTAPPIPFSAFKTIVEASESRGESLSGLAKAFHEYAQGVPHPAALLDTGLVYLALNKIYARQLGLSPSALVGREYSRVHRGRPDDARALLDAMAQDGPCELPPLAATDGQGFQTGEARFATPLKNAQGHTLGMLLEYYPESGAADAGAK